jgi:hypothetical protein
MIKKPKTFQELKKLICKNISVEEGRKKERKEVVKL